MVAFTALRLGSPSTAKRFRSRGIMLTSPRKESRGGHTRDDYAKPDPHFAKVNVVLRQRDGKITVTQDPLPEIPPELKKFFEDT